MSEAVKTRKPRTRRAKKGEETAVDVSPRATSAWQQTGFAIPSSIVSKLDLSRLLREFETIDNALTEKRVRKKANASPNNVPALSPQMASFIEMNPVDLENSTARSAFIKQLKVLKDTAPIVHMTFAVVADAESLQQLIVWLRESVHPQTIIDAHLQPDLVAGVYLRTPNHVFDFTVRNALKERRGELEKELGGYRG